MTRGRIPRTGAAKTDEITAGMEAKTLPPVTEAETTAALQKPARQGEQLRPVCHKCSAKAGQKVYMEAYHTAAYKTYYRCPNFKCGCKAKDFLVRPDIIAREKARLRGERIKTPVKDGGNYGGVEPIG
jgi:hypothetical protein